VTSRPAADAARRRGARPNVRVQRCGTALPDVMVARAPGRGPPLASSGVGARDGNTGRAHEPCANCRPRIAATCENSRRCSANFDARSLGLVGKTDGRQRVLPMTGLFAYPPGSPIITPASTSGHSARMAGRWTVNFDFTASRTAGDASVHRRRPRLRRAVPAQSPLSGRRPALVREGESVHDVTKSSLHLDSTRWNRTGCRKPHAVLLGRRPERIVKV
jgi:hypothetical protein